MKIKQLKWEDTNTSALGISAIAFFGCYYYMKIDCCTLELRNNSAEPIRKFGDHRTIDQAYAAAQTHFETEIKKFME